MPKKSRDTSDAAIKKRFAEWNKLSRAEQDKKIQDDITKKRIEREKKEKKKFEKGRKDLAKIVSPKKGKVTKEEFEKARKDLIRK